MSTVNMGTLSGVIEFDDQATPAIRLFIGEMDKASSAIGTFGKLVGGSMATATVAIGGYVASVVKLGETGSKILGVEKAFERLATQAGQTGQALIDGLNRGVKETVDSMELMQGANRALQAGVKLTAKDMETLGKTARALGQAAGTDTAQELETLFRALSSGQTRMLKLKGIIVNTKEAEDEFAKSIGTTADKLNQAGKVEAARLGMMKAFKEQLDKLGEAELTFSERIKQSTVIIGNWWDELSKAIATSPQLNQALEDISSGLKKAFEEHGAKAIEVITGTIEKVAEAFRALVPYLVDAVKWIGELWDWLVQLNEKFDITGKIVDGVKIAFNALKETVVFLVDLAKTFWNNLVDLNDRFGITDKIARAAVVAFDFLKTAFNLVREAANSVMAAWSAMPEWLQKIAGEAAAAAVALNLVAIGIGAAASPVAELISKLDLAINIFGNFTGGLYAWNALIKENTLLTGLNTAAREINLLTVGMSTEAVKNLTFWFGSSAAAEKSSTIAATIASGVRQTYNAILIVSKELVMLVAEKTGLLTLVEATQTGVTNFLTRAKVFLTAAYTNLVVWVNTTAMRMGLLNIQMGFAAIEAGKLTGAVAILMSTLGVLATVLLVVGAAITGIYLGSMLGEWLFESSKGFRELSFNISLAVAAFEELEKSAIKVGGITVGFKLGEFDKAMAERTKVTRDMYAAQETMIQNGKKVEASFDAQADAHRRLVREMSGERIANDVHKLKLALEELQRTGKDTPEALLRIGKAALALQSDGGNLHQELDILAASAKLVGDAAAGAAPKFDPLKFIINDTAEAAKKSAEALKAHAEAIDKLKGIDVILEGYKQLGLVMASMPEGGAFAELRDLPLANLQALVETLDKAIKLMNQKGLPVPEEMRQLHENAKLAAKSVEQLAVETEKSAKAAKMWAGEAEQAALSADTWVKAQKQAKLELQAVKDLIGTTDWGKLNVALTGVTGALLKINPSLSVLTSSWEDLDAAFKKMDLGQLKAQAAVLEKEMEAMARRGEAIPPIYTAALAALSGYLSRVEGALKNVTKIPIADIPKKMESGFDRAVKAWDKGLAGMAQGFVDLAEIAGDSFGGIVKWIAQVAQAMVMARAAGKQMKEGFKQIGEEGHKVEGAVNIAQGAIGAFSAINAATQSSSKSKNIMGGGMAGAQAGLAFGPWGAAVGFAVGAIVGAARKPEHVRAMEEIGKEWGVDISEGLAKQITEDMKGKFKGMRNNRWLAEVFNLGSIVKEVGLTTDNIDKLGGQLRHAFVFLDEGSLKVKDVAKILDETFDQFADFYVGRNSKISKSLREIIELDKKMAVHSKAVMDFVKGQTDTALQRIGNAIMARGTLVSNMAEAEKKMREAQAAIDKERKEGDTPSKELIKDLEEAQKEYAKLQKQVAAQPLTAAGGVGLGASLMGMFAAQTEAGGNPIEVLQAMQPVIDSLTAQLVQAGLSGGTAFDKLRSMAMLATDEIAGPAFTAIHDYGEGLKALHNANILDQTMFSGLSSQISATYNAAVEALKAQGKDTSEALKLVAPDLQLIWELQQDMGYTVDETTQKLINEAIAAGQVGDAHRSVQDQMLEATQRIQLAVEGLAKAFGVILPDAARVGADGIENALIDVADLTKEQAENLSDSLVQAMLDAKASGADMGVALGDALKQAGVTAVGPEGIGKLIEELKKLPGWGELAALGIEEALNGIEVDDINIGTNVEQPEIPGPPGTHKGEDQGYMTGGHVAQYASRGRLIQFPPQYAASGRAMSGPRGTDTVPTWLTPGEFVIKKPTVDKIGVAKLKRINEQGLPDEGRISIDKTEINYREMQAAMTAAVLVALQKSGLSSLGSNIGLSDALDKTLSRHLPQMLERNPGGVRTYTKKALG